MPVLHYWPLAPSHKSRLLHNTSRLATTMSVLASALTFSFADGHPSRFRFTETASARFAAPIAPKYCREVRSLCVLRNSAFASTEQSKPWIGNLFLYDPISFLLDGAVSLLRLFGVLPPNFCNRWQRLVEIPDTEVESWLERLPSHLIQAVTASEDQRFFYHPGVDFYGIARAVVNYPNGGGGSTITQQLVKIFFLSSERKLSRKLVEGLLSLVVEKRLSKWKILYSYLKKMYWGNGIYGVESASQFYFGKSPSFLSIGESAILAGILPSPEFINPRKNPKRSKSSQAKVLKRMVSAGFLDMEKALEIARESFYLYSENKANSFYSVTPCNFSR